MREALRSEEELLARVYSRSAEIRRRRAALRTGAGLLAVVLFATIGLTQLLGGSGPGAPRPRGPGQIARGPTTPPRSPQETPPAETPRAGGGGRDGSDGNGNGNGSEPSGGPGPIGQQILSLPVSFGVLNVNRSRVPCATDGMPYTIRGHLVAPAAALSRASRTVSLYVHAAASGQFQWTLKDVPGYDHATEMAKLGHTSVVIDRLGIDSSGHPVGTQTCVGGEADVIHQVADLLRTGTYELAGGSGVTFDRIALIGSSLGSLIVEVAAGSFDSFDAVSVSGWGDLVVAATPPLVPYTLEVFSVVFPTCARGGEPAESEPGSPTGYTTVFPNPRHALELLLYDPDPDVVESLVPLINRESCGLLSSLGTAIAVNSLFIQTITEPVLIVHGARDVVVSPEGARLHAARFLNSADVTLTTMQRAGHGPNLERAAPEFRRIMSEWLTARGY